jgi:hypothetical protein
MTEAPWKKPLIALVDDGSSMDEEASDEDVQKGIPL